MTSDRHEQTGKLDATAEKQPNSASGDSPQATSQLLSMAQYQRWDDFVAACPQGTIFHTTWWHRAWGMEPIVHVVTDKNGNIEAGMCYCIGRRFGTSATVRPPMTPCNGPLYLPCSQTGRHRRNTHAKKMALSTIQSLPRLGMYDFILRPGDCDVIPYLWNGFDTHVGYTYVLPCVERQTWRQNAATTHQRHIRKALREAAENTWRVETNAPLETILPLLKETAATKQFSLSPYDTKLSIWWETVCAHDAGRAYLLRDSQDRPVGATLMVWDAHYAYYLVGGLSRELRKGASINVLLFHRMIEDAHAMNLDFDFEGSILPGVERFFRSFGGELRPYCRLVKLPSLRAFLTWHAYRYWTRHRQKDWIWHE